MTTLFFPSWAAITPMLIHTISTAPDSDEAKAAAQTVQKMAEAIDQWNKRAPSVAHHLERIRTLIDEDKIGQADAAARMAIIALHEENA